MRKVWLGVLLGTAAAATGMGERDASACGGVFTPPTETETVITDHRMLLSVSKEQTTLYDQIEYKGAPSSFAWVLPIKGTVKVGLSADILFDTIDSLTATQVSEPPTNCPAAPDCGGEDFGAAPNATAVDAAAGGGSHGVTVTAQQQVGPYETVQLHSTDASALNDWLASHGYSIPSAVAPIISAYVADQFDFLAMKLVPGATVQAMQPVRVTSQGASAVLPLRMVAAGTGATTGITLWVVADGRYEPQNFPFFTIQNSELVWNWTTSSSNYESLRLAKEAALGGKGWQIESSLELNENTLIGTLLQNVDFGSDGGAYPPDSVDAGSSGEGGAIDAGPESTDGGLGEAGENAAANEDLQTLFAGISGSNVRITRMRSDIAHAALANDLTLQASSDQSEIANIYDTTGEIGQPLCPIFDGCTQIGQAPRSQAVADANAASSGGCHTTPSRGGSEALLMGLGVFLGIGLSRTRRKRNEH